MTAILKKVIKAELTEQCSQGGHFYCPAAKSKDGCWVPKDHDIYTIAKALFGTARMRCICNCHDIDGAGKL